MSPTVTYLEFRAQNGEPYLARLYAIGGITETVIGEDSLPVAQVDTDDISSGRWRVSFLDLVPGNYQLIVWSDELEAFAGSNVVADERYTVTADTVGGIIQPWSEAKPLTVAEIAAAAGLGSGSGVRSIVVTVEDEDENAVTGARVQVLTSGGQSTGQAPVTGLAGTVTLVLNDGSYLLRVLPPSNFDAPADTALTVTSAQTPVTIELETSQPVLDDPALSTLLVNCVDPEGAAEAGVTIACQMVAIPGGSTGIAFDNTIQTATSDSEGIASLTVVRLATYRIRRGTAKIWTQVVIPNTSSSTIKSFIGSP
jgi:hypothetical protein